MAKGLERIADRLRKLSTSERGPRYAIGTLLLDVEARSLAAGAYPGAAAFGASVLELPEDWVRCTMRVVEAYRERTVLAFGFDKLDRMLRYIASTPHDDATEDVADLVLRLGDGIEKRFEEATLRDIRRAVARARGAPDDDDPALDEPEPPERPAKRPSAKKKETRKKEKTAKKRRR
jgi:hypothetical protein